MGILIGLLLGLLVLVALLLVLIILIQDDATEGAGIIFGSAASQQYGARKGNIVTKTTGVLATLFIVTAFMLSFLFQYNEDEAFDVIGTETSTDESVEWWGAGENTEAEVPLDAPAQSFQDSNDQGDGQSSQNANDSDAISNDIVNEGTTPSGVTATESKSDEDLSTGN